MSALLWHMCRDLIPGIVLKLTALQEQQGVLSGCRVIGAEYISIQGGHFLGKKIGVNFAALE